MTACQDKGSGINLYVSSFMSFKAFTWGPFKSAAYHVQNLQIVNSILMVVDTPSNLEEKKSVGAVYLYALSFNADSGD